MDKLIYNICFSENNFAKKVKFIDKSSFILIDDMADLQIRNINNNDIINYKENNYINDFDILLEENYEIIIFQCSNENPIRFLDKNLKEIKSFLLEDILKEKILSSFFIKIEPYSLNIFTGGNFFSKIDLITNKILYIKTDKDYNLVNCFDFSIRNSFYLIGSYNKNLLFCDFKTDKIENKIKLNYSINQIKIIENKQILIGYRNSDKISLFDLRNVNKEIISFERKNFTQQKINFTVNESNSILFSGDMNGKIILYDLKYYQKIKELNFENSISSMDYLDNYLLFSTGTRNFDLFFENEDEIKFINNKNNIQIIEI